MESEFFCVFTERGRVPSLFDCVHIPVTEVARGEGFLAAWSSGRGGASEGAERAKQSEPPRKIPLPEQAL